MRRQGYYQPPVPVDQPWKHMRGLYLALVLTVDPATGTCGVELTDGSQPVKAAVIAPNANKSNGWLWLPQVGDLVVVGFLDSSSSMPVILGSTYAANDTLHSVNPGDMTLRHSSGSSIVIAADGTITVTQAAGAFLKLKPTGDIEAKHATNSADLTLDSSGVTLKQGTVKAQISNSEVLLDGGGGGKIEVLPSGAINVTPGPGQLIALGGTNQAIARNGDITSSPIGAGVPDHYHLLIASSVKVYSN